MGSEIILVPVIMSLLGFVVWVLVNGAQRRQQAKLTNDFQSRLLDRLGSVKEFNDFLQTENGAKLLSGAIVERGATGASGRILRTVQSAAVFATLGLGFLLLGWSFTFTNREVFTVIGVIALSLGVGMGLSAGISFSVARRLGVLNEAAGEGEAQRSGI